jgi:hypothetical protein
MTETQRCHNEGTQRAMCCQLLLANQAAASSSTIQTHCTPVRKHILQAAGVGLVMYMHSASVQHSSSAAGLPPAAAAAAAATGLQIARQQTLRLQDTS